MKLSGIKAPRGATKGRKRVGRGPGSGLGKTAGRGQKGQTSRVGNRTLLGFEGGQMPLHRRLPKRGFRHEGKNYATVNVSDLEARFEAGDEVTVETLKAKRLVRKIGDGVKLLGDGDLSKRLVVTVHKVSAAARSKVEAAGGSINLLEPGADSQATTSGTAPEPAES